jgi:mycothiol synthase
VRHFCEGDEVGWNALMDVACQRRPGQSDFAREMAADAAFRPQRVWLVARQDNGALVATASAWVDGRYGDHSGVLHWVASHPDHAGRGLGTAVSLAALHHAAGEGRTAAYLLTDDHRVAALKTYLRLGFTPVVCHQSHPDRWRRLLTDLAWPARFEEILCGPPEPFG